MPIPFILGAAALYAAGKGISKGLDAKDKMDEAKRIVEEIQNIVNNSSSLLENKKKSTTTELENLGKTKVSIMASSMKQFVDEYRKLKNVNFKDIDISELEDFEPEDASIKDLSVATLDASRIAINGIEAIGSGALLSAATYGSVMYGGFATASTGIAIGSLKGVAATNATLAWLGGGALKAGGFGMLGGSLVLGGLVAGPALLLGGWWLDSEAEDKLYEAKGKKDEALKYQAEVNKIVAGLNSISDRSNQIKNLLEGLNKTFVLQVNKLEDVIEFFGLDFATYSDKAKRIVGNCCLIAKAIKIILDTPLFTNNGELTKESGALLSNFGAIGSNNIEDLQKGIRSIEGNKPKVVVAKDDHNVQTTSVKKVAYVKSEIDKLRDKAKAGDNEAKRKLAYHYEHGIDVKQNSKMAAYWYSRAENNY